MINELNEMVDAYAKWLRDKTQLRKISDEWTEITTPFLDSHNDMLQIYAKKLSDNRYLLTDDGCILTDLEQSGCSLESDRRKNMLKTILNSVNVQENDGELFVESSREEFAKRKEEHYKNITYCCHQIVFVSRFFFWNFFFGIFFLR
jgi:hypothetical protein